MPNDRTTQVRCRVWTAEDRVGRLVERHTHSLCFLMTAADWCELIARGQQDRLVERHTHRLCLVSAADWCELIARGQQDKVQSCLVPTSKLQRGCEGDREAYWYQSGQMEQKDDYTFALFWLQSQLLRLKVNLLFWIC